MTAHTFMQPAYESVAFVTSGTFLDEPDRDAGVVGQHRSERVVTATTDDPCEARRTTGGGPRLADGGPAHPRGDRAGARSRTGAMGVVHRGGRHRRLRLESAHPAADVGRPAD